MVKLGFFLLVRGAWIKKPANLDLVLAAGECICEDDKVLSVIFRQQKHAERLLYSQSALRVKI